nr:G-type lectin S-receptor-like serine/threonine-protein kinase SD2-2 [Ipomoea batatas]
MVLLQIGGSGKTSFGFAFGDASLVMEESRRSGDGGGPSCFPPSTPAGKSSTDLSPLSAPQERDKDDTLPAEIVKHKQDSNSQGTVDLRVYVTPEKGSYGTLQWVARTITIGGILSANMAAEVHRFAKECGTVCSVTYPLPKEEFEYNVFNVTYQEGNKITDPSAYGEIALIYNANYTYWSTGNWTGNAFAGVPQMTIPYIYKFNFSQPFTLMASFGYSEVLIDPSVKPPLTHFHVDHTCQLKHYTWSALSPCKCFFGFKPWDDASWNAGDFSGGCLHESNGLCSESDGFKEVGIVSYDGAKVVSFTGTKQCWIIL